MASENPPENGGAFAPAVCNPPVCGTVGSWPSVFGGPFIQEGDVGALKNMQDDARDKRAATRAKPKGGEAEWRGYINVQLTAEEKGEFDDWMRTDDPWDVLSDVAAAGCVITVKRDAAGSGFMGSITQRDPASVNAGLAVTARGKAAGTALFRVVFLVARLGVLADWAAQQPPADDDRW